jgi:hypothetical protein
MCTPRDRPILSIAIAAWSGEEALLRCLASLKPQCAEDGIEVIAAVCQPVAEVERQFPDVTIVEAATDADVFRLRALAARAATGRLVAITEDHATFGPHWVETLRSAHAAGHPIIAGPVDQGSAGTAFDWALYFVEYGLHMPPVAEGPVSIVSGLNVAYERDLLMSVDEIWQRELHENEVNDALSLQGYLPYMAPEACVYAQLPMSLGEAVVHLYTGARQFARYRSSTASRAGRFFWLLASPLVPFVLFTRIARRIGSRNPRRLRHLLRGLPYFLVVLGAWSLGEARGYLGAPTRVKA